MKQYDKLDAKPNLLGMQEEVLNFWEKDKTFDKSVKNKKGSTVWSYDGPPFPTGKPHHGTVLVSFIKDLLARYYTMRGHTVPRIWGWDCHGLPVETQAEKLLGLDNKLDIERTLGIGKFNDACKNIVSSNNDSWREYVREMARWVDYDNSYKTMDVNYMESVLWAFKQCYDKGLIYQDYRVTPYCYRCETSLSISDTRESDSTRPKQDTWVMVKFDAKESINGKPTYFLAWTTTPWTLPSNMALAVGKNLEYAYAEVNGEVFVACKSALTRYEKIFGKTPVILKTCKGDALVDRTYAPLFNYFANKANEGAFKMIAADFVDDGDGVGIVHIAPAFGEDDYWVCKANHVPLVNPVDDKGLFTQEITDFAGRNVMEANMDVIRLLKGKKQAIADGTLVHNYPHCWRCKTPLIYKAMKAWYFNIDKIKDRLITNNEKVNWVPETVKTGRFGNWLQNARDWNISRNRYWSTPIPVWECEHCHERKVLGSIAEIKEESGVTLTDLHRQYMDEVTFKCQCGHTMKRIPEVLDCWFESGCVPFAEKHYPFENKEWLEKHYPSDYVVEYTGQIRCWFYYLHIMAVALFDHPAFKNCIVHGTLLDKEGKKLSKSSKNYTDPMTLLKTYGTDAYRLYLYQSNAMLIGDLMFDDAGLLGALQQILLPLWNACSFYTSYANIDKFCPEQIVEPKPDNPLDMWILAKLYNVEKSITKAMDAYEVDKFVTPLIDLLDGLTNWYIRRSRRRFWRSEATKDKQDAYETMLYVLVNLCKLLAPAAPILTEKLYKNLTGAPSVHLADWPNIPAKYKNNKLVDEVNVLQRTINLARSIRAKNNVKNRQPLLKMQVAFSDAKQAKVIEDAKTTLCDELNVKEVEILKAVEDIATVVYKPNFAYLNEHYKEYMAGIISAMKSKQFKMDKKGFTLTANGAALTLPNEAILVEYQAKQGLFVASAAGIVVSLDLTITDALKREGIAREIVRNVQDARKAIGCDISDRIQICFKGDCPAEWVSYICAETLSTVADFTKPDATMEVATDDVPVMIEIKR